MQISERPANFRAYYVSMKDAYTQKKQEAIAKIDELVEQSFALHRDVKTIYDNDKNVYPIDLYSYEEFNLNSYKTGVFFNAVKGVYLNKEDNYELKGANFTLYRLAKTQKDVYDLRKTVEFCDRMLNLKLKDYTNILKEYYYKVQEKLILEGMGYAFGHDIGWICINRCKLINPPKYCDFNETRKRKLQLEAEGKRVLTKKEIDYYKSHNINIEYEDPRVYREGIEFVYEIPLLNSHLPNGTKLKLDIANTVATSLRGKTREDIIEECNHDVHKIMQLDVGLRHKLDMCIKIDNTLYNKFIRNENQKPSNAPTNSRKNR